jgi:hypothetical protein
LANVAVRRNSWLNFSQLLESDGIAFWDQPDIPDITPQDNDTFVTVDDRTAGNLDLIAFEAYGDPDLWWVIALANKIELIPTDVLVNSRLRIPNLSFVKNLMAKGGLK